MRQNINNKEDFLYDYSKYVMKPTDVTIAFLIGFLGAAIVLHIFFGNILVDLVFGIIAGIAAQPIFKKMKCEKIKKQLIFQFKDLLDSLNSSISSGSVPSAAFVDAQKDMEMQHGKSSRIYQELVIINRGVQNGQNIEILLTNFGERSTVEDIISFAKVFEISNRRSGGVKTIIGETKSILCDKIDIEQDIHTMVNASKNQLNIMMLMPLIVIPMMSSFSSDSDNPLINIVVKIVGIIIFAVAYIIGRKITNIKV